MIPETFTLSNKAVNNNFKKQSHSICLTDKASSELLKIPYSLRIFTFSNAGPAYFLYGFKDILMGGLVCLALLLLLCSHFLIYGILLML